MKPKDGTIGRVSGRQGILDRATSLASLYDQAQASRLRRDSLREQLTKALHIRQQQRDCSQAQTTEHQYGNDASAINRADNTADSSSCDRKCTQGHGSEKGVGSKASFNEKLTSGLLVENARINGINNSSSSGSGSSSSDGGISGSSSNSSSGGRSGGDRGSGVINTINGSYNTKPLHVAADVRFHNCATECQTPSDPSEEHMLDQSDQSDRMRKCRLQQSIARQVVVTQAEALSAAVRALQRTVQRLGAAEALMALKEGGARRRLSEVSHALMVRRARMISALTAAMGLGFRSSSGVETTLECQWFGLPPSPSLQQQTLQVPVTANSARSGTNGKKSTTSATPTREVVTLDIGDLQLPTLDMGLDFQSATAAVASWQVDPQLCRRAEHGMCLAAMMTNAIADYVGVPLRHPLLFAASNSAVQSLPRAAGTFMEPIWPPQPRQGGVAAAVAACSSRQAFPIVCADDSRSFAAVVYALNKDVEQLLHHHGISSVGPYQVLHNLHTLASAAASSLPTQCILP